MRFLLFIIITCFFISCETKETINVSISQSALIPKPVSVTPAEGSFEITSETKITTSGGSQDLNRIGAYFAEKIKPATGFDLKVAEGEGKGNINLSLSANDSQLGEEGYVLSITADGIDLKANNPAGVFRGTQTILQLLPDDVSGTGGGKGPWAIGAGTIRDYPSFAFRGAMLDVSRHFFGVEDVKRYIDLIAFYKMNSLHLHLSDDQGWRIEIKSWPNLTKHGGSTQVGGGSGGFYTQEQYKDLVNYAAQRYINIIPEIDMPGHTNAALASYPQLNCNNTAPPLYTKTEVGFSTLCVRKDTTYKFIDDVVRELAAITPGPYIHLGGDESHVTSKPDFIYFINRIQAIPKKYGKKMIGWEEIAQANLDSSTIVQYWSNVEHAKAAIKKGAKLIMSPASKVYLDMKYDTTTKLGLKWAGLIEVDSAYNWSLTTRVPEIKRENILGIEAPLWTETLAKMDEIEFMVFPRLPGLAEIGWTPDEGRSWDEYKTRLAKHGSRMKALDIDFYESKMVPWDQK